MQASIMTVKGTSSMAKTIMYDRTVAKYTKKMDNVTRDTLKFDGSRFLDDILVK